MPYIQPEHRKTFDPTITKLALMVEDAAAKQFAGGQLSGMLNYTITQLLKQAYPLYPSYNHFNEMIGVLESVKLELYRRRLVPYENLKVTQNGDVYAEPL